MFAIDKYGNAVFPEGVEQIDSDAFYNNKELRVAVIPDTVKKIGSCAFFGCENLEKLVLPEGLESIEKQAFENCSKLKSFVMPDSVIKIDECAFKYIKLDEPVYNRDKSILYVYADTNRKERIVLPNTVKRIFSGAFTENTFEEIVLHEGIEQIDSNAFLNCILCKKVTVHCSSDVIKDGAFLNFRPMPDICFEKEEVEYFELLRMCSDIPVIRINNLEIPKLSFAKQSKLETLIAGCKTEEPETMIKVAEFFARQNKCEFFEAASNFWYYRAAKYKSAEALDVIKKKCNEKRRQLPTVAWPTIGNESGERLCALGFSFFDKKTNYIVSRPDENGIVEVRAYAGSDGPDEDGYGREEYYNWWFLDENLKEIPSVRGLLGYSNNDSRIDKEKFKTEYDNAVRYTKGVKELKKRMLAMFEEHTNGVDKKHI